MSSGPPISPMDLRDYLKARGWVLRQEAIKDRLYVLNNKDYPRRQLIFPMDTTAPDYVESIESLIAKLAEMTGQMQKSLKSALAAVHSDVVRLRVYFDGNDRSLPLPFATALIAGTEKLLKAAACTAVVPRIYHPRLALTEAIQFIEKSRFGQTEEGSYIVQVACPVNSMEVQGALDLDEKDTPFVRQVTHSLNLALGQLVTAIEADTLDDLVDMLKTDSAPLISANLCEALSGLHDEQIDNALDIGFNWSALKAAPAIRNSGPLRFQRDYFSRIEEVQKELKAVEKDEEDTFIGTVERLEGEMDADGRRSGAIVLSLLQEGETVRARTSLTADDYILADKAHMSSNAYVRLTGKLRAGRQPRQLVDLKSFSLVE